MDDRLKELKAWLYQTLNTVPALIPIVGDASFRRYFRFQHEGQSFIAMDAPPSLEDSHSFVSVARSLAPLGVRVPYIQAQNLAQGYLLLEDLGDRLYLRELNENNADTLYTRATTSLLRIHQCDQVVEYTLPFFDSTYIMRELLLFQEWFLDQYLHVPIPTTMLRKLFEMLVTSAQEQPQVFMHRDYHSRNLLVVEDDVGVLDFQDAMWGPVTYDAVSLLRDCYIAWPQNKVEGWAINFYHYSQEIGLIQRGHSEQQFMRWFDLMGLQRHLKAIFIFARKYLRDGVQDYLADIPRTLNYVINVSENYPELHHFRHYLLEHVMPRMEVTA
jgi:aminoglycoside/choline kinase family phosphotransferase